MASLVLHAPGGVVSFQPLDVHILNSKPFSSVSIFKGHPNPWAFHDKCELGISPRHLKRISWIARSVSEEATTETRGITEVEDEPSFEQYLQEAGDKLVVLNISTRTCGSCKTIYPKLVKMSKEYPDVLFLKIMGDLNSGTRALMRKWGVRAVPNFRFFRNGDLIHSHTGANKDDLRLHFLVHYQEIDQA